MTSKYDKMFFIIYIMFDSVFIVALVYPTLSYAFSEENATCQMGTRAGLTLSGWLKAVGIIDASILGLVWLGALIFTRMQRFGTALMVNILICGFTAKIVLSIIGITLLATKENNSCIKDGNALGILAIINLGFFWLSCICFRRIKPYLSGTSTSTSTSTV